MFVYMIWNGCYFNLISMWLDVFLVDIVENENVCFELWDYLLRELGVKFVFF